MTTVVKSEACAWVEDESPMIHGAFFHYFLSNNEWVLWVWGMLGGGCVGFSSIVDVLWCHPSVFVCCLHCN